ncbi:hypothetical protein LZY01_01880 [Levilactobacillus zymae]|uniref:Uncharacterized protein n=1 Tax=Levilactobacillus zymae TaxID=267363 RepID=A0ABQ0WT36_9LACO|nr:hypothetical protein [Levilactobacillus zymae]KRL15529.1 hypothetical protein FD38_GL000528 [Levilactobacillus zymae DSM 19395]QFR60799.1 hypothetical protein LZ395_04320 [Levilactobacillus zymae]GEO71020.1 hypothetical protein LZY01_01880 [Levilactobacillus zymae]
MDNLIQPVLTKVRQISARWTRTYSLEGIEDDQAKDFAKQLAQADTENLATYKVRGHAPRSLTLEIHRH